MTINCLNSFAFSSEAFCKTFRIFFFLIQTFVVQNRLSNSKDFIDLSSLLSCAIFLRTTEINSALNQNAVNCFASIKRRSSARLQNHLRSNSKQSILTSVPLDQQQFFLHHQVSHDDLANNFTSARWFFVNSSPKNNEENILKRQTKKKNSTRIDCGKETKCSDNCCIKAWNPSGVSRAHQESQ